MKKKAIQFGRIWAIVVGIIGGYLLFLSLAPVFLSGRNSEVISYWREVILQWTQFTGYLRLIFAAAALLVTGAGLTGIIVNIFKPETGQKLMLWGGIAALALLVALWLGLMDIHLPLLGSTDIGSNLIWDSRWGIASWSISKKIFNLFGGGWLRPAITGSVLLILTNLPRWWHRFN
jgi:hypothetical protein